MPRAPKYFIVILLIQSLFMGLFLVFALVQRTQAERQREIAVELEKEATEQKLLAETVREELEKCQQNK